MGYFKRFGDVCALFAAFSAFMYVFCQYMAYDFDEIVGTTEKLKYFFSNSPRKDYRFYLTLILLLLVSFIISTVFHKLPFLTLAAAALPIIQIVAMYDSERLYERPMLYLVLASVHAVGCLYECIRRDREDRGRRGAIATDLLGIVIVGFCLYVLYTSRGIANIEFENISLLELLLYNAFYLQTPDLSVFKYFAICYGVLAVLRMIWRDLYYVDAILSVFPFVASIYLWNSGKFAVFGSVAVSLTLMYAVSRISVMLCCKPKICAVKRTCEN